MSPIRSQPFGVSVRPPPLFRVLGAPGFVGSAAAPNQESSASTSD